MGRKKQGPMMYIQQPSFSSVDLKMQSVFKSSMQDKVTIPASKSNTKKVSSQNFKKTDSTNEHSEELKPEHNENKEESSSDNKKPKNEAVRNDKKEVDINKPVEKEDHVSPSKRPFPNMTKKEQLDYLYRSIPGVTKLKASFETEVKVWRGIIVNYQDDLVELKTMQKPFRVTLKVDEIKSIQLLGF